MSKAPPSDKTKQASRFRRRGCWRVLGFFFSIVLLWLGFKAIIWPDVARLAAENPSSTAFIDDYRASRRAAGKSDTVAWTWLP